jgi:multiple sugar transport system permease protein/sn-glycerol 3-phosphate transport system permease protein
LSDVAVRPAAFPTKAAGPRFAGRHLARRLIPYAYLAPMLVLLLGFTYWPFIHTAYLSLGSWNLNPDVPLRFVGWRNYDGIFSSSLFDAALVNTAIYIGAAIPLKVLLPIPIAVFIWSLASRANIYRTLLFLPTLFSFVVVALVVLWLLNPISGQVATLARSLGWTFPNLLTDQASAIWVIIGLSSWKVLGFNVLLYLAGLSGIKRDYIEAMRLDGASDGVVFRRLVWPLLTPTTFFVLIATVIFSIQQVFTPIDILTEGGPANSTTNLFYVVYQYAFRTFNVGYGAAGTVLLFAALLIITVVKVRLLDRHVHYQQ